ncbi:unnamed protein product [Symbiodinium necroappetens]|uniref:Uncharacterized protein n=1 Tax=Symbiodinium necroappetens TaxID=1628268 RepID=A0A812R581_9DINO|nr:unnamed protein product [Symbiodinium necroappetens]
MPPTRWRRNTRISTSCLARRSCNASPPLCCKKCRNTAGLTRSTGRWCWQPLWPRTHNWAERRSCFQWRSRWLKDGAEKDTRSRWQQSNLSLQVRHQKRVLPARRSFLSF